MDAGPPFDWLVSQTARGFATVSHGRARGNHLVFFSDLSLSPEPFCRSAAAAGNPQWRRYQGCVQ